MRVEKLVLKNYAPIYAAQKSRYFEIEFKPNKNKVTLLVGPMGSGKTSILSTLHPFAYAGSFDTRDEKDIFLEGEVGYKEIHYKESNFFYVIKHHYTPTKTGRSVKSFIMKDGEELNPNGNVTSFKEIVKEELGIDENLMRLVRLGPNVTNFADLKTASRKEYITDLMEELDVYSKYFKKINDDNRFLKNNLSNIVSKLEKLHIVDLDYEKEDLGNLKEQAEKCKKSIEKNLVDYGSLESQLRNERFLNLKEKVMESRSSLNETRSSINKILKWFENNDVDTNDRKKLKKTMKEMTDLLVLKGKRESSISANLVVLDSLYNTKDSKESQLKFMKTNDEIEALKEKKKGLLSKNALLEKDYSIKNKTYTYTKDDLLLALSLLQEIDVIVQQIYESGSKVVQETVSLIRRGKNVEGYAANKVTSLDKKIEKKTGKSITYEDESVVVLYVPKSCELSNCPYYNRYHQKEEKKGDSLDSLETKREYYLNMVAISKKIDYIFMILKTNTKLTDRLPFNYFLSSKILEAMSELKVIYNEEYITSLITEIEAYDEYTENLSIMEEIDKELGYIKNSGLDVSAIQKEYNDILKEISRLEEVNERERIEIEKITLKIDKCNELTNKLETAESYMESKKQLDETNKELEDRLVQLNKNIMEKDELLSKFNSVKIELRRLNEYSDKVKSMIQEKEFKIREFYNLKKDITMINSKFEEIKLIRSSLTSNEGIPLLFVQLYFQETKQIVNRLLERVWNGDLEIADFDISDNKFDIPYYRSSIRIDDIKNASQGESSFFSLALSFALLIQTNSHYNIMLLDEIDGPFDTENREKFIDILEAQMETINAEQVFMISHNNTFDNYAVNLINFGSENDLDGYKNVTQLKIKL